MLYPSSLQQFFIFIIIECWFFALFHFAKFLKIKFTLISANTNLQSQDYAIQCMGI